MYCKYMWWNKDVAIYQDYFVYSSQMKAIKTFLLDKQSQPIKGF